MAFMGMSIAAVVGAMCLAAIGFLLLFLILGIVKKRKGEKSAKVFFLLSAIIAIALGLFLWYLFGPKRVHIDTPTGEVLLGAQVISELEEALENAEIERLDHILSKHPELIYYQDVNAEGILDRAVFSGNLDVIDCILQHGARFDDTRIRSSSIYQYSLEKYLSNLIYDYQNRKESREIRKVVEVMLENGALVEFTGVKGTPNALFAAVWWVCMDGSVSEDDIAVLTMLKERGASFTEQDENGKTVAENYEMAAESYMLETKDSQGYQKAKRLLEEEASPAENEAEASAGRKEYHFYDESVKKEVEAYFDKTGSKLREEEFKTLSELQCFIIRGPIKTLKDIPNLFPHIRYLKFVSYDFLSKEDYNILKNLPDLRALVIYSRPVEDLDVAKNLPYFDLSYNREDCLTGQNNLSSFSVLGKDFINKNLKGTPLKFARVTDKNMIYELILTDAEGEEEPFATQERKLFVSKREGEDVVCSSVLDGTNEVGDCPNHRIFIKDVNFDGKQDILIDNGHFGNQGAVTFTCFLNNGGGYEKCAGFSKIPNPSIDEKNKKILSTSRSSADCHSWAMYTYDKTGYVMTDCLTEDGLNEDVWQYTIEKRVGNKMRKVEVFTTKDYKKEEIDEKIFNENSYWGVLSDKWNTLFNNGSMVGFSIYEEGAIDAMILDIIRD